MKRLTVTAIVAALLLAPVAANAGSLACTATDATASLNLTYTWAMQDAEMLQLGQAMQAAYPLYDTGTKDANGNEVFTASTIPQAVRMALHGFALGWTNNVQSLKTTPAVVPAPITAPPAP